MWFTCTMCGCLTMPAPLAQVAQPPLVFPRNVLLHAHKAPNILVRISACRVCEHGALRCAGGTSGHVRTDPHARPTTNHSPPAFDHLRRYRKTQVPNASPRTTLRILARTSAPPSVSKHIKLAHCFAHPGARLRAP